MSKVAVDSNAAFLGGMSRLPRPVPQGQQLGTYQPRMQNGSGKKPSKLEQMQAEYQQNIMKEKEQKLINLYEENQQRALHKVNQNGTNKGMVRDFFQERRALGSGNSQGHMNQPSIEKMFNRKKVEHQMSQQPMGRAQSYNPGQANQTNGRTNQSNIPILSQKTSAGRDRSNLLAPINGSGKARSPGNPFPNKPQIVRPRTYKDVSLNNANRIERSNLPVSAPTGTMVTDSSSEDSPPPNRQQLQMLQQKRKLMKNQQMARTQATQQIPPQPQKKTDFQKFQEEQDLNRANRLSRYREAQNVTQKHQQYQDDEGFDDDSVESDDIDPEDEIKKKQALLLQQIENQQRELERLKKERLQEEVEEKKEKARRKKFEEERKKREKEEEEWRRKAEEDERVKRTWEEEKQKKMAEEKERLRKTSQTTGYEYEDSDYEDEIRQPPMPPQKRQSSPSLKYKPSAPSKPKPAATRKYHPPKSRTPPRQESPPLNGDHLALYSTADQQDGAFENVGRLVSCFNCGRKFAEDRIEKHEKFCKNLTKKRKVLDPTKLRTQGTEMAQFVNTKQPKPKPKKSNWREKHESFMNAIKYAKKCKEIEDKGGSLADLPPPPRSENPDYVQCPYCTRRFNPQTAERHIPHCKNTKSRPGPPPKTKKR